MQVYEMMNVCKEKKRKEKTSWLSLGDYVSNGIGVVLEIVYFGIILELSVFYHPAWFFV